MKLKKFQFQGVSYNISNDVTLLNDQHHITVEAQELIEEFYFDLGKGKKSLIKRLERACKKYPKVPQFKNYLSQAYLAAGQAKKSEEITDWILEAHPHYLFGKINKAHSYIDAGNADRVPELLGEKLDLQALYPSREEFHVDEVANYYATVMRYFLETGKEEQAQHRLNFLEEIAPQAEITRFARDQFLLYKMEVNFKKNNERWSHDLEIERTVESRGYRTSTQTDEAPEFHHPEINLLYNTGFDVDEEAFRELLDLPRETLIADLEAVIEDAINRFEYFQDEVEENGWNEKKHNFSIHAVYVLAALKSEKSLTSVLDLLRQGDEFLDFWYADALEDFFNAPVATLATHQFQLLDEFLREPGNSYYARNIAVVALEYVARWYPERRDEVVRYYDEWLRFLVDNYDDEGIYDSNLLGFIIWSCINIKAEELLPLIKTLYDQDLVLTNMLGEYSDVERDIKREPYFNPKPFEIFKKYEDMANSPTYNYSFEGEQPDKFKPDHSKKPISNLSPKEFKKMYDYVEPENDPFSNVGRNDPCPCGSGRKFKKCCMG